MLHGTVSHEDALPFDRPCNDLAPGIDNAALTRVGASQILVGIWNMVRQQEGAYIDNVCTGLRGKALDRKEWREVLIPGQAAMWIWVPCSIRQYPGRTMLWSQQVSPLIFA